MKLSSRLLVCKIFFISLFIFSFYSENTYAAAFCITNPDGNPPDNSFDNRCPVDVTVGASASPVPSGSGSTISYRVFTLYQWWDNGILDASVTMTDTVTGAQSTLASFPGPTNSTWEGSVGTGPLTHQVSVTVFGESRQGVTNSTSMLVDVVAGPPTATIQFVLLKKARNYLFSLFTDPVFAAK